MAPTIRLSRPDLDASARRISQLARALRDLLGPHAGPSSAAARQLAALTPTAGELAALAGDGNPFVRCGAVWWMRNLPAGVPAPVVEALRAAACDPNGHVVQAALGTAGILRLAAVREDARACLDDPSAGVVHSAIFALGRIGPPEEGARLVRFLGHRERHLELAALSALASLAYAPAAPAVLARLGACRGAPGRVRSHFELPRRAIAALVAMRAREAAPLLVEIARDEIGLRGMAVQALIDLRAAEAGPALLPLLARLADGPHEEKLTCRLLELMAAVDYRFALPQVRGFLRHRVPAVRGAALAALARWRDPEAGEAVRVMARQDPSAFVRPAAVSALGEIRGEAALPDLEALAGDANALVRAAVAEALGRLPAGRGREALARLADDPSPPVARAAREALGRAGEPALPAPAGPGLLPAELRSQAAAARAFLERWEAGLSEPADELARALKTLLRALAA